MLCINMHRSTSFLSIVVLIIICFVTGVYLDVMAFFRDCFDLVHQHKSMIDVVKVMTNMATIISASFGGLLSDWPRRWATNLFAEQLLKRLQNYDLDSKSLVNLTKPTLISYTSLTMLMMT